MKMYEAVESLNGKVDSDLITTSRLFHGKATDLNGKRIQKIILRFTNDLNNIKSLSIERTHSHGISQRILRRSCGSHLKNSHRVIIDDGVLAV